MITVDIIAQKILDYLHHRLTLAELVDWAENVLVEGNYDSGSKQIRNVVAYLGVADVKEFGLTWEHCEELMLQLGYKLSVQAEQVA